MKVGVDISALDPGFKEHQTRGIGRYAAELKKHFDLQSHSNISIDYFSHLDLMDSSLARLVDCSPLGKQTCLLYTSPSPRDKRQSRMPSSA